MDNSSKSAAISQAEQDAEKATNEKFKKIFLWGTSGILAVVVIVLIYIFAIRNPAVKKADQALAQAYATLSTGNDSLALVQLQQAAALGHDGGNLAKVYAGNLLYERGKYEAALEYYKSADLNDKIAAPGALGKAGDCLVCLGKPEEALSYFDKAISAANGNPQLVPYFLQKKARIYHNLGNTTKEADMYREILTKYPVSIQAQNAEKYLRRADAASGK